jgi:hypothetical protein
MDAHSSANSDACSLDDLIEIQDPEIDASSILAQIRERIQARRAELGYDQRTFPTFGTAVYPGEPEDLPFDADLHHHLRLVNGSFARIETGADLAPSQATRLPVIGRLWKLVRGQLHSLVLFYVNRAVAHQTSVNRHLVSVLNRMEALNQEQQRTIIKLQKELAQLRQIRDR